MYCPKCGTPNEAGAEKCKFCATLLPKMSSTGDPLQINPASAPLPPMPQPSGLPGQPGSQYNYAPPPAGQPGSPYNYAPPPPGYGYSPVGQPGYFAPAAYAGAGYAPLEAGFWVRFGAWFLDSIIMSFVSTVVFLIPMFIWLGDFVSRHPDLITACDDSRPTYNVNACSTLLEETFSKNSEITPMLGLFFGLCALVLLINLLYYVLMTASGATLGKKAFGIKVVREDGSAPGLGRSILRETIGKIASGSIFNLGYLWAAFDPRKQTWHDKIADTYVIRSR